MAAHPSERREAGHDTPSARYEAAILTPAQARTMGLPRGEILALRWSDFNLEKTQILHVRHSLERVKGEGLRLSEPKSHKAKRELRILRFVWHH
jgi:integrase